MENNYVTWKSLIRELWDRSICSWKYPSFGLYFLISICIVGALGVYFNAYEVYNSDSPDYLLVAKSLSTYFIAILAVSFADINIKEKKKNHKSFFLITLLLLIIGSFLLVCTYLMTSVNAFWPAGIGTFIALYVWIIANSKDEKYTEELTYNEKVRNEVNENHGKSWDNE